MKTQRLIVIMGLMVAFLSLSSFKMTETSNDDVLKIQDQEGLVVYATYDGREDYGYNFISKGKDGEEHTLTFQKIEEPALSLFDLNADTFVGTKFKVTFSREIKVSKDENNMDDEDEINTITQLEKL